MKVLGVCDLVTRFQRLLAVEWSTIIPVKWYPLELGRKEPRQKAKAPPVCLCIRTYGPLCLELFVQVWCGVCVCMSVSMYVCMYVCVYVYVCMHICIICLYIYIYIHIYIYT